MSATSVAGDETVLATSVLAAPGAACPYVVALRYRAWGVVWSFGIAPFVFGVAAVVPFARLLWEAA